VNTTRKFYLESLLSICRGEIQTKSQELEPVYKILEILHERGLNVEKADEYFRSPDYVSISNVMVPDLAYGHTQQRRHYDEQLKTKNIRIIGSKVSEVDRNEFERLYNASAGYILPEVPSIQGVTEFLWLLEKADHEIRLAAEERKKPSLPPIVINTYNNEIFKIISDAIGLNEDDLEKYNITLVKKGEKKHSKGLIKEVCKKIEDKVEERGGGFKYNDELSFSINANANFLLATTKDKKLLEQEVFFL